MALVRMQDRDYETAQVLLQRAIAAGNTKPKTQFALGESFRLREMYAEAVAPYKAASEGEPDNSDYGLAHGIALKKSGNNEAAEPVLRAVGELDPNAQFVWTELGDVLRAQSHEEKGENMKAMDEWSAYIRMDCCSDYSNDVAKKKIESLKATDAELAREDAANAPAEEAPAG
jgi:tetratricopeptide (TPR) repeat protein